MGHLATLKNGQHNNRYKERSSPHTPLYGNGVTKIQDIASKNMIF